MNKWNLKQIKRKRRLVALLLLLAILLGIVWLIFRKKDFTEKYTIQDYEITENYNKKENTYDIEIKKGEIIYYTVLPEVNFHSKKIIKKIEEKSTENETCILPISQKIKLNPICLQNNTQVSLYLTSEEMKSQFEISTLTKANDTYEQINISNYLKHTFYIWNYRGFYKIAENNKEKIELFSKDIYDSKLITQVQNYLWIPNFEEEHFFNSVILLNLNNGKQEIWNLKNPIYFESVILGVDQEEIYLVDKHEKIEWVINIKKKTMKKIGTSTKNGKTYQNGWKEMSITKLINKRLFKRIINKRYTNKNNTKME